MAVLSYRLYTVESPGRSHSNTAGVKPYLVVMPVTATAKDPQLDQLASGSHPKP